MRLTGQDAINYAVGCGRAGGAVMTKQGWVLRSAKMPATFEKMFAASLNEEQRVFGDIHCKDCGSFGHTTGSNTCPGPDEQDRLVDPNR